MKKITFVILLLLLSCGGPSEISEEIEGTYKFTYPSGQVEILNFKYANTFNQKVYAKESDYLSGAAPLYDNNGNWYKKGKEINLNHWLFICESRDPDSILVQPELGTVLNVYYHAPSGEHNGRIDFYLENGYVFKKIAD
jgi:hypothetical protein